jgi:hypothetical protein
MDTNYLAKTKLFEKIEIQWFSVEDMKRRKSEFRGFYQEIVDHFLQEMPNIKSFLRTCTKTKKPHRKTQRQK